MIADIKQKLVEALRSGEYQQRKGLLRDIDDRYCCLGVLYDVIRPDGWEREENTWRQEGMSSAIDSRTLEVIGLTDGEQWYLINMNDSQDKTFLEIADYIEQNL